MSQRYMKQQHVPLAAYSGRIQTERLEIEAFYVLFILNHCTSHVHVNQLKISHQVTCCMLQERKNKQQTVSLT